MDYIKGAAAVMTWLLALVILLRELWSRWRSSHNSNSVEDASRQSDSVAAASASDYADSNPLPLNSVDNASRQSDSVAAAASDSDYADSNPLPLSSVDDASRQSDSVAAAASDSDYADSNPLPLSSVDDASRQSDSVAPASNSDYTDSNPLPLPFGEYEVFLNFRGPDTRDHFTDILYRFLVNLKIRTFKDDEDLRKGEGIWPSLVVAIEQSKIYVAIFSENYAYSKWCLRELAAMVERQERLEHDNSCTILPIFYMVDPGDVRNQSGSFHHAFEEHEEHFDKETVGVWKKALEKVGAIKGWHIKSTTEEGAVADLVTSDVWSHLSKNITLQTDKLIGIDDHIEAVQNTMALDSPFITVVGIHGIGGIGKTTIAKAVYNKVRAQFERCVFVEDVREMLQQKGGVTTLQKHIISEILRPKYVESIANSSEGVDIIRNRISHFKCLVVLDDVNEEFKFDEILGAIENFVPKSRFIITSRDIRVLSTLTDDCKLYRVREMSHHHSLQLFCNHAFKEDSPPSSYATLSKDIVSVAAGLPLTLKVVGSFLFQREQVIWEDKLRQLKKIPEEEVVKRLRISYDTLPKGAQKIFLDIACFFIGRDKELPFYMWNDCEFFPTTNINILIQRNLIEVVPDYLDDIRLNGSQMRAEIIMNYDSIGKKRFKIHDQLRDMGREIVLEEETPSPKSRIWSEEKVMDMLLNKEGTNQVEAIRLLNENFEEVEEIGNECFMKLSKLRYLDIFTATMPLLDDLSNHVPNLRWLGLWGGSNSCIPRFSVKKLVILELSDFETDEQGALSLIKMASKLKVLKLSYCTLIKLPDFPWPGSLEVLDMRYCPQLEDLNIGNLGNLKVLRLLNYELRQVTNGTVGMMPWENTRVLHPLPSSLTTLLLKHVPLEWLPSLENLENLTDLSMEECLCLKEIVGLGELKSLKILSICYLGVVSTLDGLDMLYSLVSLRLSNLVALETLPSMASLSKLLHLNIIDCGRLSEIRGLGGLKSLENLCLCNLEALCNLDGLDRLYSLKYLELSICHALKTLPSMASLSKLLLIYIFCWSLTEIQGLEGLKSLQKLLIDGNSNRLTRLHGFQTLLSFNKLKTLRIINCWFDDTPLSEAQVLDSLQELYVCGTPQVLQIFARMIQLSTFPSLIKLTLNSRSRFRYDVDLRDAYEELRLDGLESMEGLVELDLSFMTCRIPSLSKLGNLKRLTIHDDPKLREIEGLAGLKSLEKLDLQGCTAFEILPADELYGFEQLKGVDIRGCTKLVDLSALGKLQPKVKFMWPDSDPQEVFFF